MSRLSKLSFVGIWLRRSRRTKRETFKKAYLCQIEYDTIEVSGNSAVVNVYDKLHCLNNFWMHRKAIAIDPPLQPAKQYDEEMCNTFRPSFPPRKQPLSPLSCLSTLRNISTTVSLEFQLTQTYE